MHCCICYSLLLRTSSCEFLRKTVSEVVSLWLTIDARLMAMYYNGYIIICILTGAFLGAFAFSWQAISISRSVHCLTAVIPVLDLC